MTLKVELERVIINERLNENNKNKRRGRRRRRGKWKKEDKEEVNESEENEEEDQDDKRRRGSKYIMKKWRMKMLKDKEDSENKNDDE